VDRAAAPRFGFKSESNSVAKLLARKQRSQLWEIFSRRVSRGGMK